MVGRGHVPCGGISRRDTEPQSEGRVATIKDIAVETGLSKTTVSLVLSDKAGTRGIAVRTCQRVREAALRLGYHRNGYARALRTGHSNLIGITGLNFEHPVPLMGVKAAAEAVLAHGYGVFLNDLAWLPEHPERVVDDIASHRVEGLLILESRGLNNPAGRTALQRLIDGGLPVVTVDDLRLRGADVVSVNRDEGAYLATRHLLSLGHRRIVMTVDARAEAPALKDRLRGYDRALREAGLETDPSLLLAPIRSMPTFEDGIELAARVLENPARPSAMFCVNDRVAIGAMQALFARGVRIPDGMAIVGFDGIEEAAYTAVPLTTVSQPMAEVAEQAISLLLERIRGQTVTTPTRRVRISPRLVVRRSCGAGR